MPQDKAKKDNAMAIKVAINGFGRIGRNVLRAIIEVGAQRYRRRRHQRSG